MTDQKQKPRCPRCHVGGYTQGQAHDGRPQFTCGRCDHVWTCGHSGGGYLLAPPKPRHTIRTKIPGYFFGAMRAADSHRRRHGVKRKTAKLPTTFEELPDNVKAGKLKP